jgi:hypothetical protein
MGNSINLDYKPSSYIVLRNESCLFSGEVYQFLKDNESEKTNLFITLSLAEKLSNITSINKINKD